MSPRVIEIFQSAVIASQDGKLPAVALRARAWRRSVVHRARDAALPAHHVVGGGAPIRAVHPAITEFLNVD